MIPLRFARLCADCDTIFDGRPVFGHVRACPTCGSFHSLAVQKRWWLNDREAPASGRPA